MNLDELRSVQAKERRKDSVQHLRDSFYDDVAAYIADLRAARDRRADAVENPFSDDDVRRMSDEIETAEEVAEALYERRVGKVVKLASFAAADMPVETEGLTTQERALFDDLVDRIGENKAAVLDVLTGESSASSDAGGGDAQSPSPETNAPTADEHAADSATPDPGTPDSPADVASDPPTDPKPPTESAGTPGDAARSTPGTAGSDGPLADAMGAADGDAMGAADGDAAPGHPTTGTDGDSDDGNPDGDTDIGRDGETRSTRTDAGSSDADADPTPVDPDPAPPGAPGVSDGGRVTGAPPSENGASTPGGGSAPERPSAGGDPSNVPAGSSASSQSSGASDSTGSAAETGGGAERTTVRITRDVGPILGVDEREYDLASEDVVTLPAANADPLVERDAAERID